MLDYKSIARDFKTRCHNLSLRSKISIALIFSVSVVCGLVMLASYLNAYYLIVNHTQDLLNSEARLNVRELEIKLQDEIQSASEIASNPITANALADTQESELYLVPLLNNRQPAFAGTALTVVDYRGRPIASNLKQKIDYASNPAFSKMMQLAQPQVFSQGHDRRVNTLLIAFPVQYRLSGQVEGGVILEIPIEAMLGSLARNHFDWLEDASGKVVAGKKPELSDLIVSAKHEVKLPKQQMNLSYFLARDRGYAFDKVHAMLIVYFGIALIALLCLLAFARVSARYISEPLEYLSKMAQQVSSSGRPGSYIYIESKDEYGALAKAFNTMFARLDDVYQSLEARVKRRTTELEKAKSEVEQARNLLHEAVASAAHGFSIFDQQDRLVVFNEAYRQFTQLGDYIQPGRTYQEIMQRSAALKIFPQCIGREQAWIAERMRHHQNADASFIEVRRADDCWFLAQEVKSPSGYVIASRIDITHRKHVELALAEAEMRWASAITGANDGVWDWNLQTNKVFFSERWKAMLGLSQAEVSDSPDEWQTRVHPDDLARSMALINEHLQGKTAFYYNEHRLRCRDGSYKWILARGKAFLDEDGRAIRLSGSHTDITDKKLAEAIILDRTQQLDEIFALSPDGFVSFDKHGLCKYANPAFYALTNLEPGSVVGLSEIAFGELLAQRCKPDAKFSGLHALRDALGENSEAGADVPPEDMTLSGQMIELASPGNRLLEISLKTSKAETVSEILIVRDVTHEVEVSRIKSDFLSTAAHELRTPMSSIYGYAELLLAKTFSEQQQREFYQIIHKQAAMVSEILNELLDLQRIESRRGKDFVIAQIEVSQLIQDTVSIFKVPEGRAAPAMVLPEPSVFVRVDRSKMMQVINNVLSNAYKYSPKGGEVEITVKTSDKLPHKGMAAICVRDHGIGMTPEQLARVCERFYRADTSGALPGTGLGMSIVKEVVELHQGKVEIESQHGAGTTVSLWLPLDRRQNPQRV